MISLLSVRASACLVNCLSFLYFLFIYQVFFTNSVSNSSENVCASIFCYTIMPVITRSRAKASVGSSGGLLETSSSSLSIGSSSGLLISEQSIKSIGSTDEPLIPPTCAIGSADGLF